MSIMTSAFTCSQDALFLFTMVIVCVRAARSFKLPVMSCGACRGRPVSHTHTHAVVDTWLQRRMRCACGGCCQVKCSRRVWRIFLDGSRFPSGRRKWVKQLQNIIFRRDPVPCMFVCHLCVIFLAGGTLHHVRWDTHSAAAPTIPPGLFRPHRSGSPWSETPGCSIKLRMDGSIDHSGSGTRHTTLALWAFSQPEKETPTDTQRHD